MTIDNCIFFSIPAGTKLYAGKANGLFGFQGEGFQFYIDKLQFTSFDEIEALFSKPISVDEYGRQCCSKIIEFEGGY